MVATVVILALGCCTFVLLRHRKGRLAAALPLGIREQIGELASAPFQPREKRSAPVAGRPSELTRVTGLTMREAEDWLDWLEQNGYSERGLVCENEKFAVEYRVDAGHTQGPPHTARTETTGELKAIC